MHEVDGIIFFIVEGALRTLIAHVNNNIYK